MCSRMYVKHVSNGLVEKMLDDLGSIFFSSNIITKESIGIFMWELNKVYDMGIQSVSNKGKKMVYNQLKSFKNGNFVHFLYY